MSYKLKLDVFEGPLDLLLFLIKKDDIDKITCSSDKPHCITSTPIKVGDGDQIMGKPSKAENNTRLGAHLKKGEMPNAIDGGEYLECKEIIPLSPVADRKDDNLDPNSPLIQVIIGLTVVIGLGFTIKFVNDKFG